ncbi:hypothetical protein [Actinoplanes sp. NPDC026619]|uniref:hypothetical protein n=1 Tax=Actinoplanes sp. NPDC026619 TaxID=3155798 RepID=UPI00340ADE58
MDRLRRFPGRPIPTGSVAQRHLELQVLRRIGFYGFTERYGWKPGDPPFAIDWIRPMPNSLDIAVRPDALPEAIGALLPMLVPGSEPTGVRGLRPRLTPHGVELSRIGLPGMVCLRGVRLRAWQRALDISMKIWDDPDETLLLWRTHPDVMHPDEEDIARSCDAGYAPASEGCDDVAAAASIVLRRQMIFRGVTDIRVWTNPGSIQLEWYGGDDHAAVAGALLDPVFGMPGSVDAPCTCHDSGANRCWSVELDFVANPGGYVNLRRGGADWTDRLEQSSEKARQRRSAELRPAWAGLPAAPSNHNRQGLSMSV